MADSIIDERNRFLYLKHHPQTKNGREVIRSDKISNPRLLLVYVDIVVNYYCFLLVYFGSKRGFALLGTSNKYTSFTRKKSLLGAFLGASPSSARCNEIMVGSFL
jgi:hypothetical protein